MGERTSKRSKGVDVEPVRTIPTTCLETAYGKTQRLSFQIKVF